MQYAQQPVVYGAPQGQMQYYPSQAPQVIVVEQQPQIYTSAGFGRDAPTQCVCPNCRATVLTRVDKEPGCLAYFSACVLGFIFLPFACLPCCIPGCLDTIHSCPSCGASIARVDANF